MKKQNKLINYQINKYYNNNKIKNNQNINNNYFQKMILDWKSANNKIFILT